MKTTIKKVIGIIVVWQLGCALIATMISLLESRPWIEAHIVVSVATAIVIFILWVITSIARLFDLNP
jgi:small neutral amino acid transporter SnatA (MarC family)